MAKKLTLQEQVSNIINEAAERSEELIKGAVRERMRKKPYPKSFIFSMGTHFFERRGNHTPGVVDYLENETTRAIQDACDEHLDAFGTMTWRIDRQADGTFEELTDW